MLAASLIGVGTGVDSRPRMSFAIAQSPTGQLQQSQFSRRLTRMAAAIDRAERSNRIANGPATFMRQDLDRIWSGVTTGIAQQGALTQPEYASYQAMLDRVAARLARCGVTP